MNINEQTLIDVLEIPAARAVKWCDPVDLSCRHYGITRAEQVAAFLAQIGHESGRFRYVHELWGPMPWQLRYEGRVDLGNTEPGDGHRYMGRGLIQITGRSNYERCGNALGLPLAEQPELLEEPVNAAMSAAWYWNAHNLNDLADVRDIKGITKIINGGYNGLAERSAIYYRALAILDCDHAPSTASHSRAGGNPQTITVNDDALL